MPKPEPKQIDPADLPKLAAQVMVNAKFPMLATIDGDQPRVRPISPVKVEGFTVYMANLSYYSKTAQIAANPNVELCYLDTDHNQVRITGVAEVVTDRPLLEDIWQKNRLLQHYLGTIDNPDLIVYKIVPHAVNYMQEWALTYLPVPLERQ